MEVSFQRDGRMHFLLVLICPTCPQLAHFRSVPAGFGPGPAALASFGEAGESAAPSVGTPFCLSRARRRSLLRWRRESSFSILTTFSGSIEDPKFSPIQLLAVLIHLHIPRGAQLGQPASHVNGKACCRIRLTHEVLSMSFARRSFK